MFQIDKRTGQPKIWVYKDKMTGKPKGEATVTYEDEQTASSAIDWFNGELKRLNESLHYSQFKFARVEDQ